MKLVSDQHYVNVYGSNPHYVYIFLWAEFDDFKFTKTTLFVKNIEIIIKKDNLRVIWGISYIEIITMLISKNVMRCIYSSTNNLHCDHSQYLFF